MLTRPIPQKMREEMSQMRFYKSCCIGNNDCTGKIEWHHNLTWKGQRVNEIFCILPVCKYHHDLAGTKDIKSKLDWIMLNRATNEQIINYSKAINYQDLKNRLNKQYGTYKL